MREFNYYTVDTFKDYKKELLITYSSNSEFASEVYYGKEEFYSNFNNKM